MGNDNLAVTLTPALYEKLAAEAKALDLPLEWLVASMILDTFEEPDPKPLRTAA